MSIARIADVLAEDYHNVTVIELDFALKPGVVKAVKKANLWTRTFDWPNRPKNFLPSEHTGNILYEPNIIQYFKDNYGWRDMLAEACMESLRDGSLIEEIKREKYDAIFMEQIDFCGQAIGHLAEIKTKVWISSCPLMEHMSYAVGVSSPSSYVPATMDNSLPDKMNTWQRFRNFVQGSLILHFFMHGAETTRRLLNENLDTHVPDLLGVASESALIFTNIDEFLTFPRPNAPNIINVGGLGLNNQQIPLESPFKELMEKSKNGVIYFALGSVLPTHHLPLEFRKNMLKAFAHFKDYQVIMKISEEDEESREIVKSIPNVYVTTWAPQSSILSHPNMRLCISHGGYNSVLESARFGVPMLLIPLANDAYSNSRLIERNKWGLYFEKKQLLYSHTEFQSAIDQLLNNPSFKKNAVRTQKLFLNKPISAEDKLKKYVRLLEMSDGELKELQPISRELSLIELYNLDVFAILFSVLFLTFYVFVRLLKMAFHRLISGKVKKE